MQILVFVFLASIGDFNGEVSVGFGELDGETGGIESRQLLSACKGKS